MSPFLFFARSIHLHGRDVVMKAEGHKGVAIGAYASRDDRTAELVAGLGIFNGNQERDKDNGQGNFQELTTIYNGGGLRVKKQKQTE